MSVTQPITVSGVKTHLVGLDNWLSAAARSAARYDDLVIASRIGDVIREFERTSKFRVNPVQVYSLPDDGLYTGGNVPAGFSAIYEDGYDYRREMAQEYFTIPLRQYPAMNVQRVRVAIGGTAGPGNNTGAVTVFTMPNNWYSLQTKASQFSIAPVYGPLLISSLNAFSALEFQFGPKDYLPNCIKIDYQAGLPLGWQDLPEWADLRLNLERMVACQVLGDISEMADAGLSGVSVSGGVSSESYSYTRFKERREELQTRVDLWRNVFEAQETPILMSYV